MDEIYNLKMTKKYFINNSKPVICKRGNQEFEARYYIEAESFYQSNMKLPEQLILQKIIKLECDIKDIEKTNKMIQNFTLNMIQEFNKRGQTCESLIKRNYEKIQEIKKQIQTLIKENPKVEPLYIMHIITK